ncbi:MAG: antirestriction protein ArdA [Caldilineaceae bacterium]
MTDSTITHTEQMTPLDDTPSIYVACLAAYNDGILHGAWIDATEDPDAITEAIRTMLKASPIDGAEEHAIYDYDNFHGLELSEYTSINSVHAYATFIKEHGKLGAELLTYTGNIDHAEAMMSDGYAGCYESLADFAQELTEGTTDIPENLVYYIDYERMARDMELSGDIFTITTAYNEVHILWNQ